MTDEPQKPDFAAAAESARVGVPKYQPVLVAVLVGAIIVMIALGAVWTSF